MSTSKDKVVAFAYSQGPLVKRLKSWLWRALMLGAVTGGTQLLDSVNVLEISPLVAGLLSLALSEFTKHINNVIQEQNKVR